MSAEHLITPPDDLVRHWWHKVQGADYTIEIPSRERALMYLAYSGGWSEREVTVASELRCARDGELTACCVWLHKNWRPGSSKDSVIKHLTSDRRAAIHPKPPSLKEQALAELERGCFPQSECIDIIRRALEALPNE